jgi:hypothetical protein
MEEFWPYRLRRPVNILHSVSVFSPWLLFHKLTVKTRGMLLEGERRQVRPEKVTADFFYLNGRKKDLNY